MNKEDMMYTCRSVMSPLQMMNKTRHDITSQCNNILYMQHILYCMLYLRRLFHTLLHRPLVMSSSHTSESAVYLSPRPPTTISSGVLGS